MDVQALILTAKLGGSRKDAQVDTCAVFAAALYDLLEEKGIDCKMVVALKKGFGAWAHSIVEVGGRYFDSKGEFSTEIYRARAKLHPSTTTVIEYQPDHRDGCYEDEFDELHAFYLKMLRKSAANLVPA